MTKAEFKQAFAIAASNADLSKVSIDHLFGCALPDFTPTTTTLEAVAALMRWQALRFDGSWNHDELADILFIGKDKKRFTVIGGGEYTAIPGNYTAEQVTAIRVAARMF